MRIVLSSFFDGKSTCYSYFKNIKNEKIVKGVHKFPIGKFSLKKSNQKISLNITLFIFSCFSSKHLNNHNMDRIKNIKELSMHKYFVSVL